MFPAVDAHADVVLASTCPRPQAQSQAPTSAVGLVFLRLAEGRFCVGAGSELANYVRRRHRQSLGMWNGAGN